MVIYVHNIISWNRYNNNGDDDVVVERDFVEANYCITNCKHNLTTFSYCLYRHYYAFIMTTGVIVQFVTS